MLNGKFFAYAVAFWIAVALLFTFLFYGAPQVIASRGMYLIIAVIVAAGVILARRLGSPWSKR